MKQILCFFIFFKSIAFFGQQPLKITINFKNITSNKGAIYVALFNSKKSFLKTPYKTVVVPVTNLKSIATFDNLKQGTYAISAFHDSNNNQKMDTNFIGIPKEPIGISNDGKGFIGNPRYKKAKFVLNRNKQIDITLYNIL